MFRRLKTELFSSETDKLLKKAHINKTHDFIHPKYIYQISTLIILNKTKNQLLNFLHKSLNSSSLTLQIKSLIVLHACLRVNFDQEICELVMNQQENKNYSKIEGRGKQQIQLNSYINEHIINFYILYLKKMCMNKDTFYFMKKYISKTPVDTKKKDKEKDMNIQVVNHGFKILNLCNYLFQSLQMFNKMGRYFIDHQEIISMYIQILQDFDMFNNFFGKSLQAILAKNLFRQQYKKQLTLKNIKLDNNSAQINKTNPISTSDKKLTQQDAQYAEQTKHFFVYMRQSQKVLDRLYQFFHIRYYFKIVRQMMTIPAFLTIKNTQYNKIENKTKKIDRNLVQLNIMSKYDLNRTFSGTITKTQPNIEESFNESMPNITYFQTQPAENNFKGGKYKSQFEIVQE